MHGFDASRPVIPSERKDIPLGADYGFVLFFAGILCESKPYMFGPMAGGLKSKQE